MHDCIDITKRKDRRFPKIALPMKQIATTYRPFSARSLCKRIFPQKKAASLVQSKFLRVARRWIFVLIKTRAAIWFSLNPASRSLEFPTPATNPKGMRLCCMGETLC